MLANRSKSFKIGCLSLGLLFCIVGGMSVIRYQKTNDCFASRPSLQDFTVIINRGQQDQLIKQSQKFADIYEFKFDIVYYTPNGDNFLIDMIRKDVEVVIGNTPVDLDKFYVNFYNYDCIHPTIASNIDGLVSDLKRLISEIPSARITEEK